MYYLNQYECGSGCVEHMPKLYGVFVTSSVGTALEISNRSVSSAHIFDNELVLGEPTRLRNSVI